VVSDAVAMTERSSPTTGTKKSSHMYAKYNSVPSSRVQIHNVTHVGASTTTALQSDTGFLKTNNLSKKRSIVEDRRSTFEHFAVDSSSKESEMSVKQLAAEARAKDEESRLKTMKIVTELEMQIRSLDSDFATQQAEFACQQKDYASQMRSVQSTIATLRLSLNM
jgi:hypothetical protein